jgi:hypothetical protein
MNPEKAPPNIRVEHVHAITPHSKALYETGKAILLDSVTTGREFCKSMITISTGAIPVYLGILTFILPKEFRLGWEAGLTVSIPAVGFLVAATMFVGGYLPISGRFSLDILDEIEEVREKSIAHRQRFIRFGLAFFGGSTLWAIAAIIINIGVK